MSLIARKQGAHVEADALPRPNAAYDAACQRCSRLASFLDAVRAEHPRYFCRPVAPFGEGGASLVIVGLAPGLHGANATGRPFTGDYAGVLLFETLHAFGYASAPVSAGAQDGLVLRDCRITNAVKCLPPGNKPTPAEIRTCNDYLAAELATLPAGGAVLALGRVAHDAALRALGCQPARFPFAHGASHPLEHGGRLFDSYHCSRYNTNTRRLTPEMFRAVFVAIDRHRRAAIPAAGGRRSGGDGGGEP